VSKALSGNGSIAGVLPGLVRGTMVWLRVATTLLEFVSTIIYFLDTLSTSISNIEPVSLRCHVVNFKRTTARDCQKVKKIKIKKKNCFFLYAFT
jgi:hypothetical protein